MKRALVLITALLIPGTLGATAAMGIYFECTPGSMACNPAALMFFEAYLYVLHADHYVTAVEYTLVTPDDPGHALFSITEVTYPDSKSIHDGDPFSGHSIAYWPPLNGFMPGYNLLCILKCVAFESCWDAGGAMIEYDIVVGPHPESGWLRGTFAPDNDVFDIVGLTSRLCPEELAAVKAESRVAMKSLDR